MAFDFYFAGTQCLESTNLLQQLNCNVLKSYVNDKKEIEHWINCKKAGWSGKLLIDSGAFTVHRAPYKYSLNVDEYCNWVNKNDKYLDYVIQIDDIPGEWGKPKTMEQVRESPINTWNNYLGMLDKLNNPKLLLPVFHQGENLKYLEQMVNFKHRDGNYIDYICISGNKELTNKQREYWYEKCYQVIKNSDNPNVRVHCLGSATLSNVEKFPFTSMDATSWIMTGASGSILTDFGTILVSNVSKKDKKHIDNLPKEACHKVKKYLEEKGINLEDCRTNYKFRMLANIYYLYDKSRIVSFNENIKFKKRGLF